MREGDFSYDFMAIEEGTAKVHHGDEVIAELGPGEVFGEMGVLDKALRSASVTATSPILLITLTSWDIRRLRNDAPEASRASRTWCASAAPATRSADGGLDGDAVSAPGSNRERQCSEQK